ncbi:MAG TPA: outer membrane protein transport protein [Proteiniphilum sp.]|nr:outer membrane protein transport protein [Proteiniphilum sp.]HPJ49765.1 outer membrane protein transport protein [Proteiniphilum sp.]HPR19279.1 outer membrane protein transport protein [Proteiniphilum sp.]
MNKITYLVTTLLIISSSLFAQGEVDALRFSREGLYGTARAMSMGGAFGALGGDQSALAINPAGIGVYRSSEVVGTFNLSNNQSVVGDQTANKTRFNMDNLGFVGYFPLRNDMMPVINFGFSYNKLQSFDRNISAIGTAKGTLIDYIAKNSAGIDPLYLEMGDNLPDPFLDMPWLTVLGYNSWLIDPVDDEGTQYEPVTTEAGPINEIRLRERGYIDNYDFTVGTTIGNVINLGFALSIKDISYSLTSDYLEDFNNGGYTLTNWLNTTGAGVSAKIGAIYRPVNELRLGLAYHTPTWYALTETYEAQIDDDMGAYISDPNYQPAVTSSKSFINDYDLKTPGKLVASIATVLGGRFIASLDYEMTDYSKMKLALPSRANEEGDWYEWDNEYIAMDFRPASTIRAGMEYRFTQQFSGRLGYAWMQNPYDSDLVEFGDAAIVGSNTIYRIEGDTNYLTGGFGYRFNRNFFLDMAVVYSSQTDDLYPFPNYYDGATLSVDASPFKMDNNSLKGLVTLGYKF